jgi:hypothetical protein
MNNIIFINLYSITYNMIGNMIYIILLLSGKTRIP